MLNILPRYDRFGKERCKYKISLMNESSFILSRIQHKVLLLVLRTAFAVSSWLLSFLQLKLWARIPFQMGDSPSAVFPYLCVDFHKCVIALLYFKVKFDQLFICAAVTIDFKLRDIKLESSEAYLLKLEKNLSSNSTWRYKTREPWGFFAEVREKSVFQFKNIINAHINISVRATLMAFLCVSLKGL